MNYLKQDAEDKYLYEILEMIRTRRQELGMSQSLLAELCGHETSGKSWIHKIEKGTRKRITVPTLIRICSALKVEIKFVPQEL